jgi:hypothetical protein
MCEKLVWIYKPNLGVSQVTLGVGFPLAEQCRNTISPSLHSSSSGGWMIIG